MKNFFIVATVFCILQKAEGKARSSFDFKPSMDYYDVLYRFLAMAPGDMQNLLTESEKAGKAEIEKLETQLNESRGKPPVVNAVTEGNVSQNLTTLKPNLPENKHEIDQMNVTLAEVVENLKKHGEEQRKYLSEMYEIKNEIENLKRRTFEMVSEDVSLKSGSGDSVPNPEPPQLPDFISSLENLLPTAEGPMDFHQPTEATDNDNSSLTTPATATSLQNSLSLALGSLPSLFAPLAPNAQPNLFSQLASLVTDRVSSLVEMAKGFGTLASSLVSKFSESGGFNLKSPFSLNIGSPTTPSPNSEDSTSLLQLPIFTSNHRTNKLIQKLIPKLFA